MGILIYSMLTSLDGYIEDRDGRFGWARPDEEVHRFVNELQRSVGTHLYGRRMYDTMVYWETAHTLADQPGYADDYAAIWQAGRQDRVLEDPRDCFEREDAHRTQLRSRSGPAVEDGGERQRRRA
jgi:dihydrofolate reductase